MTFTTFTRVCFWMVLLLLAATVGYSMAQSAPPPLTCDQQLEQAQRTIIQLRKANAQAEFRAASLEESMLDAQKKQAEASAKTKAAEAPKK